MNMCQKKGCPDWCPAPMTVSAWGAVLLCSRHGRDFVSDDGIAIALNMHFKDSLVMDTFITAGNVAGVRDHMDAFMVTRAAGRAAVRAWLNTPDATEPTP